MEGLELPILKTIPWDKLDISVLAVEYRHGEDGNNSYLEYMKSVGYREHSKIQYRKTSINLSVRDYIFVKNDLK